MSENKRQSAMDWAARYMSGEMSPQETQDLKDWLSDPGNQSEFEEITALSRLDEDMAAELLAEEFEQQLHDLAEDAAVSPPASILTGQSLPAWARIAASIAFVGAVGAVAFGSFLSNDKAQVQQFATTIGEIQEIALADGSSMTLNSSTTADVTYSRNARHVSLTAGEGMFSVSHNANRPFTVEFPHGSLVVTGTSFSVDAHDETATISVVSGSVNVRSAANLNLTLMAGQEIELAPDGRFSAISMFDPNLSLAWRDGKVRFSDRPLGEALKELNRYFPQAIELGANELAELRVTGEFSIREPNMTAAALAMAFDLDHQTQADKIILSQKAAQ